MAPNWDRDFDDDANDFEPEVEQLRRQTGRRHLYGRVHHPTRPIRTWNGKPVSQMESDHILNAILFCEKRFAEAKRNHAECFSSLPGSAHPFYYESPFEMFPEYIHLRGEWDERSANK